MSGSKVDISITAFENTSYINIVQHIQLNTLTTILHSP